MLKTYRTLPGASVTSQDHSHREAGNRRSSTMRSRIALVAFGGIAAYFLLTEHRAHLFGVLPYLLILACPLMHMFMHGGHSHSHGGPPPADRVDPEPRSTSTPTKDAGSREPS